MQNLDKSIGEFTETLLSELTIKVNTWLKNNKPYGSLYRRPIKKEKGFEFRKDHEEAIIDWRQTAEVIFGRTLESLDSFQRHKNVLDEIYLKSSAPPPRNSNALDDCSHDVLSLIGSVLSQLAFIDGTLSFRYPADISAKVQEFLLRDEDQYELIAPITGLQIENEIEFKNGKLEPLSWDQATDLLALKAGQPQFSFEMFGLAYSTLEAKTLLKVSHKQKRGSSTLMCPSQLQAIQDNVGNLLRLFGYSSARALWCHYFLYQIDRRSIGSIMFGDSPIGVQIKVYSGAELESLKKFLNKHVSETRLEEGEFGFVFTRLNEAWNRARSTEFRTFDYVSILEALMVESNQGEFQYRVATLTAAFVGSTQKEKKEVYNLVKKAYKVRSLVAHCARNISVPLSQEEMKQFGDIVHKAIRFAFENGRKDLEKTAFDKLLN